MEEYHIGPCSNFTSVLFGGFSPIIADKPMHVSWVDHGDHSPPYSILALADDFWTIYWAKVAILNTIWD